MPWRRPPQAASFSVLSAVALIAAAAGLRESDAPAGLPASINSTLTRDDAGCAGVRSTVWHPLSGIEYTGRLLVTMPARFGGALVLYIGDVLPLDVEATNEAGDPLPINAERMSAGAGVLLPPDYWLEDGSPDKAPREIIRAQIDASGEHTRRVTIWLGRRAPRVLARLVNYPPEERVAVCADPVAAEETYFATGWYGQERDAGEGTVRWMRDRGAVLVSSADGRSVSLRARLSPATAEAPGAQVSLRINDAVDLEPRRLRAGFADYEWRVPDTAWVAGTNEVLFSVSRTVMRERRELGLALASLDVR